MSTCSHVVVECADWNESTVEKLCLLTTDTMSLWGWFLDGRNKIFALENGARAVAVLDSQYIALPINVHSSHWVLCLIVNPNRILTPGDSLDTTTYAVVFDSLGERHSQSMRAVEDMILHLARNSQRSTEVLRHSSKLQVFYPAVGRPVSVTS